MGSDSFFVIGKSHEICEDYATDGILDDQIPYAIVCDGCSSAPDTDFGSRLLSKAIEKNIPWLLHKDVYFTSNRYIIEAKMYADIINLNIDSLHSTAMLAFKANEKYHAHVYGDGVVVAKTNIGYDVYIIEFPSGAPGYITYALDNNNFEKYKTEFGLNRIIHKIKLDINFNVIEKELCCEYNELEDPLIPYMIEYSEENCEFISIMSDGVQSFNVIETSSASKIQKVIPLLDVLKILLNFKGMQGEFVKRRFKKFMKTIDVMEWDNFDDVSLGVVS